MTIDSLAYNYTNYSNKLLNVIDGLNDPQTKLGDFRTSTLHPSSGSKGTSTTDYSYDGNGNLVKDLNKDIVTYNGNNGIEYNHLNLPKKITVKKDGSTNKGYIEYTYDAVGNKLKKTTFEPGVDTTVTLYMGGLVFKNDTLEFIAQEEGRIRKKGTTQLVYDYMLKDHLGNVRMLLTTEKDTSFYPAATLETANLATERLLYAGVDTGRVNKSTVSGYPNDTYTSPNDFTQKLNGNGPKIGTNMVLKVMAGDKFNIFAKSWYKKNGATPGTPVNPLSSLLNVMNPAVSGITSTHGGATLSELQTNSILNPAATSFLNSQSGYTTSKPKAFVNWVLFDEQFKYVSGSSGFEQVGDDNIQKQHNLTNLSVSKNGYLYIYVSNETPNIDVFFDNLTVTHVRGPVLEETHYYLFGLTMAGISSKALAFGESGNKAKFNSIEQNNDFDLNMYDAFYRNLDPQIGRFWQIDPKPNERVSSYAAMLNNPIAFSDPLGDTTWLYNQNGAYLGVVNDKLKNQVHYLNTDGDPGTSINISGKGAKSHALAFRKASIAFVGNKTLSDMKSIVNKSIAAGVEIGFVGAIGKNKEIRLKALPIDKGGVGLDGIKDEGNTRRSVPLRRQITENYSSVEQNNLFLAGHIHVAAYLDGVNKSQSDVGFQEQFGRPTASYNADYNPALDRGTGVGQRGPTPSMLLTPRGVTIYGLRIPGQPANNTYLSYKSLK